MSLVFRNALMPSEDQQALRLRLVYFMRRLRLIIQLIAISALLLGTLIGSIILITTVSYVLIMGMASPAGGSIGPLALLVFFGVVGLFLYWNFIVLKVFKHVRKRLRQKPK